MAAGPAMAWTDSFEGYDTTEGWSWPGEGGWVVTDVDILDDPYSLDMGHMLQLPRNDGSVRYDGLDTSYLAWDVVMDPDSYFGLYLYPRNSKGQGLCQILTYGSGAQYGPGVHYEPATVTPPKDLVAAIPTKEVVTHIEAIFDFAAEEVTVVVNGDTAGAYTGVMEGDNAGETVTSFYVFAYEGAGALDNITDVPEPATLGLLTLGGLALLRRKR